MSAISHQHDKASETRIDVPAAHDAVSRGPHFSLRRVLVGTTVATGIATGGLLIGLGLAAATIVGAAAGTGAIAAMTARHDAK